MKIKFILSVFALPALIGGTIILAEETAASQAPAADAAQEMIAKIMSDPYKAKLLEMKAPRDKLLAEIKTLDEKTAARKEVMGKEDPEVGKLAAEVDALTQKLAELSAALEKKFSEDAELKDLQKKAIEVRQEYMEAQRKINAEFEAKAKAAQETDTKAEKE